MGIEIYLTDKAYKDFEQWLYNHDIYGNNLVTKEISCGEYHNSGDTIYDLFEDLPLSLQQYIVMEWFDMVGLVISIDPFKVPGQHGNTFSGTINLETPEPTHRIALITREEAVRMQIQKANRMYNER